MTNVSLMFERCLGLYLVLCSAVSFICSGICGSCFFVFLFARV